MKKITILFLSIMVCNFCMCQNRSKPTSKGFVNKAKGISPNTEINKSTSYYNYNLNNLYIDFTKFLDIDKGEYSARAYADFDKDGDIDLVAVKIGKKKSPTEVEFHQNNEEIFIKNQSVFNDSVPTYVHARKAFVADFDNNGWPDVAIAGHGYDVRPFPGEKVKIMLNFNGKFSTRVMPIPQHFYHSGCAGDINNDGNIDLFFSSCLIDTQGTGRFLLNDGKGNFTYDASIYPAELKNMGYFGSELYDVNNDGYLDLITIGHEMDPDKKYPSWETDPKFAKPIILWGNSTGKYTMDKITYLPMVKGWGVANEIDFIDFNGDWKTDIITTRTGDPNGSIGWYKGYYLQLLRNDNNQHFTDVTEKSMVNNADPKGSWINWIRIHDINGDGRMDVTTDDKSRNLEWINMNGILKRK